MTLDEDECSPPLPEEDRLREGMQAGPQGHQVSAQDQEAYERYCNETREAAESNGAEAQLMTLEVFAWRKYVNLSMDALAAMARKGRGRVRRRPRSCSSDSDEESRSRSARAHGRRVHQARGGVC